MILLCNLFFEISWQQKILKSWRFLALNIIALNFVTGKILLKQAKTLHSQIRIWYLRELLCKNSLTSSFLFSKYLKWLNPLPSPRHLTRSKPDVNRVKGKSGCVHLTNFCCCAWPSKILRNTLFTFL